ncbi:MAG: class A beta-lactamase-related serine hydrolase [Candidatus Eremiobacteraeota bacterium]|nr:class A beta-lactamase-related serine hydrolase [Candidatus Eremiobacteraeota bacterium]
MKCIRVASAFMASTIILIAASPPLAASQSQALPSVVALADHDQLTQLAPKLARLANRTPGVVAVSVVDLSNGYSIAINGDKNLPAASTIKVPVMVEVFRQIDLGKFGFNRSVSLLDRDRDCGYGSLCGARWGATFTVWQLLWRMITVSDNTATNMLIRLVGRQSINQTMNSLGCTQTWLGDSIRSDGDVRELRTSANDMMRMLDMIAQRRLITPQASDIMLEILAGQRHNHLLPEWLPKGLTIAHKTGTLHDTLNDVGIVELDGAPYVICVLTTHLQDLDAGQLFIRQVSLLTFRAFFQKNAISAN